MNLTAPRVAVGTTLSLLINTSKIKCWKENFAGIKLKNQPVTIQFRNPEQVEEDRILQSVKILQK